MTQYQLFQKDPKHLLLTKFAKSLMETYEIGTPAEKAHIERGFPYYFKHHIDPVILERMNYLNAKKTTA